MNQWRSGADNDWIVYDPDMQELSIPFSDPDQDRDQDPGVYSGGTFPCGGAGRQVVASYLPQIQERVESHPATALLSAGRRDDFQYGETVNNGVPVLRTVIRTGVVKPSEYSVANTCICEMNDVNRDPGVNMYWTRQEIDYFAHKTVKGTNQLWKLFLPLEIRLYAERIDPTCQA